MCERGRPGTEASLRALDSLVPRPHPQMGKGLVTFELVVLCQQSRDNHTARIWHKTYCSVCSLVRSADTAQPRKRSNVTRPFPICGWGLGKRLCARLPILRMAVFSLTAPTNCHAHSFSHSTALRRSFRMHNQHLSRPLPVFTTRPTQLDTHTPLQKL